MCMSPIRFLNFRNQQFSHNTFWWHLIFFLRSPILVSYQKFRQLLTHPLYTESHITFINNFLYLVFMSCFIWYSFVISRSLAARESWLSAEIQSAYTKAPTDLDIQQPLHYAYIYVWITGRCPWCNGYRRRKWTRRHEFKSWMRLIVFSHSTNTLGKGMNPIILPPWRNMGK